MDWDRIDEIFLAAADLPPAEQERFVRAVCNGNSHLLRTIQQLLQAERTGPDLASAIEFEARSLLGEQPLAGMRLGAYRVVRAIGHGGMGTVYLAERADDEFSKQVAIKVVRGGGFPGQEWGARFRQERQILARLEHRYLARMIDAGTTAEGVPFLVMEYVAGVPVTRYCEQWAVPFKNRLELFLKVCEAVQYAHQNLVVHRDLKPGNILVEEDGTPRLLDFGIARLLEADNGNSTTAFPETLQALTPQYASPEQVRGEAVTTAADVYSLGAILFEMLVGQPAHSLAGKSNLTVLKEICEADVTIPEAAGIDPDLKNILRKAMQKEPHLRYASAEHFADDVRRYLEHQPVLARPQTLVYRTRKFLRRYRAWTVAACVVALVLIAGASALMVEVRTVGRRSLEIQHLADTLLSDIQNRIQPLPGSTAVQEALVKTSLEYLDRLAQESGNDSSLLLDLAQAYQKIGDVQGYTIRPSLGHRTDALNSYRKGLDIVRRLKKDDRQQRVLALLLHRIGYVNRDGNLPIAQRNFAEALPIAQSLYAKAPADPDAAELLVALHSQIGTAANTRGDRAAVEANFRRALQISEEWAQRGPSTRARVMLARNHLLLTRALQLSGDLQAALDHAHRAVAIFESLAGASGPNSPWDRDLMNAYEQVSHVSGLPRMLNLGDMKTALEFERKTLAIALRLAASDPNNFTAWSDLSIADRETCILLTDRDPRTAKPYCEEAREIVRKWLGTAHPNYGDSLQTLGAVEWKLGHSAEALVLIAEAETALHKALAADSTRMDVRRLLLAGYNLRGRIQASTDPEAALQSHTQALTTAQELLANNQSNLLLRKDVGDSYEYLGHVHLQLAHRREAQKCYSEALAVWSNWSRWGHSSVYDQNRSKEASRLLAAVTNR